MSLRPELLRFPRDDGGLELLDPLLDQLHTLDAAQATALAAWERGQPQPALDAWLEARRGLSPQRLDLTHRRPTLTGADGGYVGRCRDRLADHGLVSAGIFRAGRLEAWVCSCRVLPHRVASTLLAETLRHVPDAAVTRVDTGRNGATAGWIEAAREGPAPWVRVEGS